jgi:hypothetical protein
VSIKSGPVNLDTRPYEEIVETGTIVSFFGLTFNNSISNDGVLTLTNSTVSGSGSYAGVEGGGILNRGTLTLTDSTVSGNSAFKSDAGGILNDVLARLTLINSTVSDNTADITGGGIENLGKLTLISSTVSGNTAGQGGGIFNTGEMTLTHSIIAGNPGGNCDVADTGHITDLGYNLTDASDMSCGFTLSSDVVTSNPGLASSLAMNGGLTQTLALLSGSPAIDAIPLDACHPTDPTTNQPIITDQRGMARPDDNERACDIGAYETQG